MELRNRIPLLTLFLVLLAMAALLPADARGQCHVGGFIVDAHNDGPLTGANVVMTRASDGHQTAVASGKQGAFGFDGLTAGEYVLSVKFLGYEPFSKTIRVASDELRLGKITITPTSQELDEVKARATLLRQELRGDTTVYNAAAFKVAPDATTEDLLKKMPGMQVKDGTVKHGGEEIKKVLVDGKEFFSSDPSIALRNIDANMVDKIEVFDKQSEQSEFTGISDGNEERTLNILTKTKITGGSFGQAFGGIGTDMHFETGLTSNTMTEGNRYSAVLQLNDIGQRGFSASNASAAANSKCVTGIAALNVSIARSQTVTFDAGYSTHVSKTKNHSTSRQEYLVKDDNELPRIFLSSTDTDNNNADHRLAAKIHWRIDSLNTIDFRPDISIQKTDTHNANAGQDTRGADTLRTTARRGDSESGKAVLKGSITFNHKFRTPRRTISLQMAYGANQADTNYESLNEQTSPDKSPTATGQKADSDNDSRDASATLAYTEPLGKRLSLMLSYTPQLNISKLDKTVEADTLSDASPDGLTNYRFSPILSNNKQSRYIIHRPGLTFTLAVGKVTASLGVGAQEAILDGEQTFPLPIDTRRSFFSLMPNADLRVGNKKTRRIRLSYRTNTTAPSVAQLQDVVDVSNIRRYISGNPDLRQSYTHNVRFSFIANNREKSRMLFLSSTIRFINDQIILASYIADADSIIRHGITLPAGTQYDIPINLDGNFYMSLTLNASTPVKWQGCILNSNIKLDFQKEPGLYMGERTTSRNYAINGSFSIANCLGETWDFNIGYDAAYNIIRNDHAASSNYNYYKHTVTGDVKLNVLRNHLFFYNTLRHDLTSGMGSQYDASTLIWNSAVGGRFLKGNCGELRLRVNDVLDRAEGRSRNVGTASVTTSSHSVIGRYAMLTFSYKIKGLSTGDNATRQRQKGMGGLTPHPRN